MSISVALTTFNGEKYLEQLLKSLSSQTHLPSELVVCDDISIDSTIAILQRFALEAPFPVHICVNKKRLGYRDNFMQAAELCSSELIAFCDQDDIWHPKKLELTKQLARKSDCLLLQHGMDLIDAFGNKLDACVDYRQIASRDPWAVVFGLTQVFRKELLAHNDLRDNSLDHHDGTERMAHDQWIYFLALSLKRIEFTPISLIDYRQHSSNAYGIGTLGRPSRSFAHSFKSVVELNRRLLSVYCAAKEKRKFTRSMIGRILASAQKRIEILKIIGERCLPCDKMAITETIVVYEQILSFNELRLRVYSADNIWRKACAFFHVYFQSCNLKGCIKDAVFGVLLSDTKLRAYPEKRLP